ncbi:hypothetical protein B5T_00310 [Alloalcanivorax dieselolei B5]|uniref:DUF4303 domain-containing protein n=1 Tax=Alcanivorax dieselolei (strain DSM 16502 / CGMCC 1.3690 / MCCC 1A00001 / B-5) TaxID=930169 RepID=K0CA39_ALCDB|nr:DUF4303 domain-containing protein [Alloalcanivorax dieselolei]AFT68597.1 hypothetical protein B5T_00310 [Alloalcanivorax dieselolei B5]GGK10568.1 hypothetical protein GCM10007426_43500 [Alloalcanivorax dieselolei]
MMADIAELQREIYEAIRAVKKQLDASLGDDPLFGFALGTDDDVRGVHHIAASESWVESNKVDYPEIGFVFTDWEQAGDDEAFAPISNRFRELMDMEYANSQDWGAARDQRFELLVRALIDCRKDGVFAATTLLDVGSTDPSEHMERLEMQAIERLNAPAMADRLAEALCLEAYRTGSS